MTPCEQKGIVPGTLLRVVDAKKTGNDAFCAEDMIVKLSRDDGSNCPWFSYVSGPKGRQTPAAELQGSMLCFHLDGLEVLENPEKNSEDNLEFKIRVLQKENEILTRMLLKEGKL